MLRFSASDMLLTRNRFGPWIKQRSNDRRAGSEMLMRRYLLITEVFLSPSDQLYDYTQHFRKTLLALAISVLEAALTYDFSDELGWNFCSFATETYFLPGCRETPYQRTSGYRNCLILLDGNPLSSLEKPWFYT